MYKYTSHTEVFNIFIRFFPFVDGLVVVVVVVVLVVGR